jgi:protoporphyrinogen oxidase
MVQNKHIIIAGAGPAGLTAAYKLLTEIPGVSVSIYESTDRIGGISATIEYKANRIDIGGHRFFSKSREINDFWKEFMPLQGAPAKDDMALGREKSYSPNGPDPEKTDRVMLLRRRVSRIFYRRHFFDYPITLKARTFYNMGLVNTVKAGFSFVCSNIHKRTENSLEDFYINRFGKHLYSMFFEDYTEKVWGIHPSKISANWGSQRIKELSISTVLKESLVKIFKNRRKTEHASLIEEFIYPKKGPGQFWEIIAKEIEHLGGKIILKTSVTGVSIKNKIVDEITIENDGGKKTVYCDAFFSTMPIKDLITAVNSVSNNAVPPKITRAALELPYRDFITVGLLVKKLNLKNKTRAKTVGNIVPDCWIYIQERDVKIGRLQIFNNWSPYMVADYENTVWMGLEYFCNEGDEIWNLDSNHLIEFAINELVRIKIIEKSDVLDATQVKIKKAYPAYFGSYDKIYEIQKYLDMIANLYCIGRNGQHKYNNMDHSMLTAMEAVRIFSSSNTSKNVIWNVNTEGGYHENK